jgi:hypothetical protein
LYLSSYLVVLISFAFLPSSFTPATHGEAILSQPLYPRGESYEPPSSSTIGYELCPDIIALVWKFSFFGLSSENPYHHLREFEQLCSCSAFASMTQDVFRWKLFPFSLKGRAEQWYTFATGVANGSWDNLRKIFSLTFFKQNEKETIGTT